LTIDNHLVGVLDLSGVVRQLDVPLAGVLGGDVWGCVPFSVDHLERTLTLYRRDAFRPPAGVSSHELILRGRPRSNDMFRLANPFAAHPIVKATVDGHAADVMLDTGAGGTIGLMPQFARTDARWQSRDDGRRVKIHGANWWRGMGGRTARRAHVRQLEVLGMSFDLGSSALAFTGEIPWAEQDAIVGAGILARMKLTFDYAAGRIWAEPRPANGAPDTPTGPRAVTPPKPPGS
jgi:hypothetical protein